MADAQNLASQNCEPCSGDSPPVPETEWPTLLDGLPEWEVRKENDVPMLTRVYRRKDFLQALELAKQVGELAEAESHHPRLIVEYGRLTVSWWTHAIDGLHRNDFIMAARTDGLA